MKENLGKAIEQMKNGDEKGFNEVYSHTYNRVYFRAKQIMKNEEDAQDLTQIVFVEAYKSISSLQAAEALYSWLDEITYRQGMKIFRKKKDVLLTEDAQIMLDELENNDISSMPELTADQKATSEVIRGIIEELPELQKTAIVMYYYDGLKVEQIAEMMECSTNTIKSRLNYARKYIKEKVEEKEKKEGYRLHVFGLPVFWFAIKTMADRTTLTAEAAQGIYNGACVDVGLKATAISAVGTATAGTATKATGIGAKFASLSTTAKALIIAGTVAVAGAGVTGTVYMVTGNNDQKQEAEMGEQNAEQSDNDTLTEVSLSDDLSEYLGLHFGSDGIVYPYKVSDMEYRFRPEDLLERGEQIKCALYKEDISKLPEGIELAVANNFVGDIQPEMLITNYLDNFTTDSYSFYINAEDGFIIKLVDTSTTSIFDAWTEKDDFSEFIKLYEVEVSGPYHDYEYKYDAPTLTATKINDGEYRFYAEDLAKTYHDGQIVGVRLNLPCTIQIYSIIGGDVYVPGTTIDYAEAGRDDANIRYFPISTETDIIVKVERYEGNHGKPSTESETEEEKQKTLADIDLSGFVKMQSDNSYEEISGGYFTHTDTPLYIRTTEAGLEGYWTLNGQELHFYGSDMADATVEDLEGNALNIHIGLYTMQDINTADGCIYIYTTATNFRDYPNYVYIR